MSRIVVLDEHTAYRSGLCALIAANVPRAEVVEASSLIQALSQLLSSTFNLALVDADLSGIGPLNPRKAAREASPNTHFAIISASDARTEILAGLAAGFHGFISKHQSDTDILSAITEILSGRFYVPSSVVEAGDGHVGGGRFSGEALPTPLIEAAILKLTKRQREVLLLLARGKSNKEIARALDIAEATTKIHVAALLRTLGVRNRTEAAFKAANLANQPELSSEVTWESGLISFRNGTTELQAALSAPIRRTPLTTKSLSFAQFTVSDQYSSKA